MQNNNSELTQLLPGEPLRIGVDLIADKKSGALIVIGSSAKLEKKCLIGAITLTLRQRDGVKKQSIPQQIERKREDAIALRKVESGKGIG